MGRSVNLVRMSTDVFFLLERQQLNFKSNREFGRSPDENYNTSYLVGCTASNLRHFIFEIV